MNYKIHPMTEQISEMDLNTIGMQGWELIQVLLNKDSDGTKEYIYYFKKIER